LGHTLQELINCIRSQRFKIPITTKIIQLLQEEAVTVLRPLFRIGLLMVLKQGLWRRLSSWLLPPFDPIWSVFGQNIEEGREGWK